MQRVSCELAHQFVSYAPKARKVDYFIAISDELVKNSGSLVPAPEHAQLL